MNLIRADRIDVARYVAAWEESRRRAAIDEARRTAEALVDELRALHATVAGVWPTPRTGRPRRHDWCPDCGAPLRIRDKARAPFRVDSPRCGAAGRRRVCGDCYPSRTRRKPCLPR